MKGEMIGAYIRIPPPVDKTIAVRVPVSHQTSIPEVPHLIRVDGMVAVLSHTNPLTYRYCGEVVDVEKI